MRRVLSFGGALCFIFSGAGLFVSSCADDEYSTYPPKIYFASDGRFEIGPNDTVILSPRIIYDFGSTYQWSDVDGGVLSDELELEFIPKAMKDYSLVFKVNNDAGADTFFVNISVLIKADFEEIDNYSSNKSSVLVMCPDTLPGAFRCKNLEFANSCNDDTTYWYGFALCNRLGVQNVINSQTIGTAYVPNAASKGNRYLSVNAVGERAMVLFDRQYTPRSIDVVNDNLIFLASKFGFMTIDSVQVAPAGRNDYYRVVIKAIGDDGQPTGAEVRQDLVECSFDNPAKYFRNSEWISLDLSSLGRVRGLLFNVETSMTSFPPLFCIDNLRLQD